MNREASNVLDKIVGGDDAKYYLGQYKSIKPWSFAVIKISGECLDGSDSLRKIAEDIVDLYSVGLIPVVTHGWGKILNKRLEEKGIESRFHEATHDRITDSNVMDEVLGVAKETAITLIDAISNISQKVRMQYIDHSNKVVIAQGMGHGYGSHNGKIVRINKDPVLNAVDEGRIPIVSPIGVSENGMTVYNLNSSTVGAALVKEMDPIKYLMVTGKGGVLNHEGKIMSEIVLNRDYLQLVSDGVISEGMKKNVDEAKNSLEARVNGCDRSVQIVSPYNLIEELFSRKGAGTYIRIGYTVDYHLLRNRHESGIRMRIEKDFGEKLIDNYFSEHTKSEIYIERDRKGFGIVMPDPAEVGPCLDVLVVGSPYRRNGLGTDVIRAILDSQHKNKPTLFWRSRIDREASGWYADMLSGEQFKDFPSGHQQFECVDGRKYNGFWIGLSFDEAKKAIEYMKKKPSNFKQAND